MDNSKIVVGIDIGSLSTDVVVLRCKDVLSYSIVPTLASSKDAAERGYREALEKANLSPEDISRVVATGYGRHSTALAHKAVTEITCHALGARHLYPEARTVIDIGGQDSKVIKLAPDGRVEDFVMNDKCAAGTGRFLEVMARSLDVPLESLGELSARAVRDVRITATCTVFAESEVVALVARGVPKEEIVRGLHRAIAERIAGMVLRLRAQPPFVMTGGVAKNTGVVAALREVLSSDVLVPSEPQIVGALGAALVAQSGA
ncbi:MAG: acyl-CoA dehydratase activase [Armatimonadota bacterium]|nr:acyl-CoA dehydratase activase [Armatimonadota bacterium]